MTPKHSPGDATDIRLSRIEKVLEKIAAAESFDARMARIEEKIDALDKRLSERCNGSMGRIESLEKSVIRLGERVGKMEAFGHRQEGGILAISKILAVGVALGGLFVKLLEWLKGGA